MYLSKLSLSESANCCVVVEIVFFYLLHLSTIQNIFGLPIVHSFTLLCLAVTPLYGLGEVPLIKRRIICWYFMG